MRADNPTEPVYFTPPSYENLDFSDELLWTESESLPETMVSPPKKIMRSQRQYNRRSKPQKPKKQKIRTYTRRQTEIKALKGELKQLNQQMDSYGEQAHMMRERARLVQQQRTNKDLVEALRLQRLSFSTTAAMLSQFIHSKMTGPFDALTKLGIDACGRHAALLAMRYDRLQFARQFMLRQRQLLGFDEYCERKKFKADNGDLVSLNYEIIPLPGARSIKSMVEALQRFVHNIEINISEATGDVTVRENDDAMPDSAVTQHRLVTKIGNAMESESNNVAFGEYYPASPGLLEQALMVCDVVEEDKLFPYRRSERLRQDVITIISLESHQGENNESNVVMTRWLCQRIHSPAISVPQFAINRIRNSAEKVAAAMLSCCL